MFNNNLSVLQLNQRIEMFYICFKAEKLELSTTNIIYCQ